MHPHLLHRLVEEVFSLGVRAGFEDGLEVVEQRDDVRAVELRELEVPRLGLKLGPCGLQSPELNPIVSIAAARTDQGSSADADRALILDRKSLRGQT